MEIEKIAEGTSLTVKLSGRMDTSTAPQFEKVVNTDLVGVQLLTLDLEKLEYLSSAGLRVILGAQKVMNKQGEMVLINVCDEVRDIFDITGFSDILTIR